MTVTPASCADALPANWLSAILPPAWDYLGRIGTFYCGAAAGYLHRHRIGYSEPRRDQSSLHWLLGHEHLASGAVAVAALEPPASEGEELAELAVGQSLQAVVFGGLYPDERQRGRAAQMIAAAGVPVLQAKEDWRLAEHDRRFWIWASWERPYIQLKISLTGEGAVVPVPGRRTSLAGPQSKVRIHALRGRFDALLVGARTVRLDDPQMTYRGAEDLPQPRKLILSRSGNLSPALRAFRGEAAEIRGGGDLGELMHTLATEGVTSVLVEGGLEVYCQFIEQSLVDEVSLVWTHHRAQPGAQYLPRRLPYGRLESVGDDVWETILWPAMRSARTAPPTFDREQPMLVPAV